MVTMEADFSKRARGEEQLSAPLAFELPFSPEMSLPHQHGVLIVSPPEKRKVGRPFGSKNKQKMEDVRAMEAWY